jgi:hypothetical protein
MATTSITDKDEFRNMTSGWLGVVEINHEGRAMGTSVEPGGSCFLSEEEQILTANAPREDADNPFANGSLKILRRGLEIRNRRPFGGIETVSETGVEPTPELTPEETGATPAPQDAPALGVTAPGEEVATPSAVARPKRRAR